jgi:hypothetical protein
VNIQSLENIKNKQYRQSLIDKLDSLYEENPKLYWNIVNELQGKSEKSDSCAVPSPTLVSHFKTLSELKSEFHNSYAQLSEKLKELEKINCFNELESIIMEKEISKAISHLKNHKSPGLDNISNNMIKHSQTFLFKSLQRKFNFCLSSRISPNSWANGYITAIHKGNDQTDPNNYRGITITGAIGKVFNRVLSLRLDKFLQDHNIIHES